ncbi:MAG: prolyl oligopeptidase family serine peptidase [Planctomycetota bacterium]
MHRARAIVLAVFTIATPLGAHGAPPQAPKRPVCDTYWGVEVTDEYQYLEDVRDPEVTRWAKAQNAWTRGWLDGQSHREAILKRVTELTHSRSPRFFGMRYVGSRLFAIKFQPPKEQAFLGVFSSADSLTGERAVVDPTAIDPTGSTSIDFYVPSLDGSLVAVSLSVAGTENGTLHIFDTATGRELDDRIPRVNGGTAGGDVAWTADGKGLYYTRYPYPGERPDEDLFFYQQVWFHTLGAPIEQDTYVLGEGFPRIAEIELATSPDGQRVLATVSDGDGGEYAFWLKSPDGSWNRVANFKDMVIDARFSADGALYLLSRAGAPHKKILRLGPGRYDLGQAEVVVPQTDAVIRSYLPAASRLYVVEMLGGPTRLRVYDLADETSSLVDAGEPATISGLVKLDHDEILLSRQTYLTPSAWYRYCPDMVTLEKTPLAHRSPADYSDCTVVREFATADDGTKIPVNIVALKGTRRDGSNPLLLYGYGSYGFTQSPYFSAHRRLWIEQGGIYAVANVRGGGAYGDEWHRAANLENKKVTIDDFAACARHLVARQYTAPDRLAIEGGSAGGLMVYGVMVHHPQVASAVLAKVGIGDVLRTELSPNGEFNITEFGTVTDATQFWGMYGYSPYHHITDGTVYPAVLATTGMNDPRVEPWQSFKMVARLQASGSPNPVLLRVSYTSGHGGGTRLTDRDEQLADAYAFLFAALDVPYRAR